MAIILKTQTGMIPAHETEIVFEDVLIEDESIIEVYYDRNDVYTVESSQTNNSVRIVVNDHDYPVGVKLLINNVTSFSPYNDSYLRNQISALDDIVNASVEAIGELQEDIGNNTIAINNNSEEITELQTNKQDNLVAGENITIENNVISSIGGSSQEIYDDTERVIGTWFGKPLYRKLCTISNSSITVSSSGATITFTNESYPTNADKIINARYTNNAHVMFNFTQFSRETYPEFYATASPNVTIRNTGYIILEYTKVGD